MYCRGKIKKWGEKTLKLKELPDDAFKKEYLDEIKLALLLTDSRERNKAFDETQPLSHLPICLTRRECRSDRLHMSLKKYIYVFEITFVR